MPFCVIVKTTARGAVDGTEGRSFDYSTKTAMKSFITQLITDLAQWALL